MLVYKITNTVTGSAYVGVTRRLMRKRWNAHCGDARRGGQTPLHRAIRKYGRDSFSITILCECSSLRELAACERGLIAEHGTFSPIGYNLTSGGDGCHDATCSAAKKQKLSDKRKALLATGWKSHGCPKGFRHSEATKEKMRRPRAPREYTAEQRKKLGDPHRGDKNVMRRDRSVVERAAATRRGQQRSEDQRLRIERGARGRATTKLTEDDAAEIRRLVSEGISQRALAAIYSVDQSVICDIKNGRLWKGVAAGSGDLAA